MATPPPGSYEKFSYLLRPSKQVERKLIIETIQRLRNGGFPIQDYIYVGLGSVYYADFALFHKYLYLDRMVCAEATDIPRRMRFNKPFRFIQLRMQPIGDVLPDLSRRERHFVWLDYDYGINEDVIQDIESAINVLAADSILLVTVDVEPRHQLEGEYTEDATVRRLMREFRPSFEGYIDRKIRPRDFSRRDFPSLVAGILQSLFRREAARRADFRFSQLFNFLYADGAQMLSFGGVIGNGATAEKVQQSKVAELPFVTRGRVPITISVPPLTAREKEWLDQNVTSASKVRRMRFELRPAALNNYRRYRRYYPSYYETLL